MKTLQEQVEAAAYVQAYNGPNLIRAIINRRGDVRSEFTGRSLAKNKNKGYIQVSSQRKTYFLHRLLLSTFKPLDDYDNMTVDHIDGNKTNNSLDNLQWLTWEQNVSKAHKQFKFSHGEKNYSATMTNKTAAKVLKRNQELKANGVKHRRKKLCDEFGISLHVLKHLIRGKTFKMVPRE
jgi:hypothetical protein